MSTEQWLGPKQIAAQYNCSREYARQVIIRIMGDDDKMTSKNKGRGKRPYRLRRVPQSLLEKHLDEFFNG